MSQPVQKRSTTEAEKTAFVETAVEYRSLGVAFATVWIAVSMTGGCNAHGSAEFQRISALWVQQKFPLPIREFIRREANRPPADDRGVDLGTPGRVDIPPATEA